MSMQGDRTEGTGRKDRRAATLLRACLAGVPLGRWLAAACLAVTATLATPITAQTGADAAEGSASAAEMDLDATDAYRLALLRIKAHLAIALELTRLETPGAAYHMSEAPDAIFRRIAPELERRGASLTEATLEEVANAADREPARALPAIESAIHAVDGSFAQTGAMDRGSVLDLIEALLREAVANYRAAVSDNAVDDVRKYRTGGGLVTQAEVLVLRASAIADVPGQADLRGVVRLIRQAWPGITPPPIVFDPESVAERLDRAVAIIDEMR